MLATTLAGCSDDGTGSASEGSASGTQGSSGAGQTTADLPTTTATTTAETTSGGTLETLTGTSTVGTIDPGTTSTGETVGVSATGTSGGTASSGDSTTGGPDLCEGGTLCGQVAVCCPAGNECIDDACLPECASEIRCGPKLETCCDAGTVCSGDQCVLPGLDCLDSYDCNPGEYCEQTLQKCLPQPDPLMCEYIPDFDAINAVPEWSWIDFEVISSPAVADLDGDGVPEVVVNTTKYKVNDFTVGAIFVLDGKTGLEKFHVEHLPANKTFGSHGRTTLAVGDVSGDGLPDIVYVGREINGKSPIHAIDGQGVLLWTSHLANNAAATTAVVNGAVTLANFDDDPQAEVVVGATLIDHDGVMVWNQGGNGGIIGSPAGYPGGISAVADLDDDGVPDIITGKQAWKVEWTPGNPPTVKVTERWNNLDGTDGWPAIADLDQNGTPEVVLAASGLVRVLDGATGKLWCGVDPTGVMCNVDATLRTKPLAIPGGGLGGPPTIADFDGDGRPELAIAASTAYTVFDLNRADEQIVKPMNDAVPKAGAIYRRWSAVTQDQSSNVTGSSVFDFQGDGAAEVTYNDECYARVYSGSTGQVLLQIPNSSSTIHEYPLVVDADADGNSEILMVANSVGSCNAPGYMQRKGVFLYGDPDDQWVPTRRVWTQHTYHVSNATSAGNVPASEINNWKNLELNNYRQNVQGAGVFNAPDLTVQLSIALDKCPAELALIATVRNEGALGVPAGIAVDFYAGIDATGTLLGSGVTMKALLPGASTKVTLLVAAPPAEQTQDYFVEVDLASKGDGEVLECQEDNNGGLTTMAACPSPG
ncbi:MAG: VCBS repeat-containing protein [Nannocystis sp.]|nr:VCBS repeat-containing protein [Nannocystis sp.]MBA3548652.1 VCBS repeat-containing protein [Nannocystis sp.]